MCAAKQGQQQHRELQRTMQHTWSPTQRYSSSRVSPVARQDCEGVRCSRAERFFVRAHRIAPVARGRPPLENREESARAAMHAQTATAPRRRNCRFTASSRFLNCEKGRAKWAPFAAMRHAGPNLLRGVEEMERLVTGVGLSGVNKVPAFTAWYHVVRGPSTAGGQITRGVRWAPADKKPTFGLPCCAMSMTHSHAPRAQSGGRGGAVSPEF